MKTTYYDKNFLSDPLELANFSFDKEISSFKFNSKYSTMFLFTPNGKDDAYENYEGPTITLAPLPSMSETKANDYIEMLVGRMETLAKAEIKSKTVLKTTIAGHLAFLHETEMIAEGKVGYVYQAIIIGKTSCIMINCGCLFKDLKLYKGIFQKTANSIKFK